ncbi:hypothetical protein HAL1_20902 [Halomonas sp. HAL1]|nr:hypothetical protein HAL1_20902 [Halomonas sp. HAL1]
MGKPSLPKPTQATLGGEGRVVEMVVIGLPPVSSGLHAPVVRREYGGQTWQAQRYLARY